MQERSSGGKTGSPEMVVGRLVLRLKRHAFGDLLLAVFPPVFVGCYLAFYLRRAAWVTQETLSFAAVALIVVSLLLAVWRHFFIVPPAFLSAPFLDQERGAKERG